LKSKYLIAALIVAAQSTAFANPNRTIAASALRSLVSQQNDVRVTMSEDIEDGADIAFACINKVFEEWGDPVYQSVFLDADAQDPQQIENYISTRDTMGRDVLFIQEARPDLLKTVSEQIDVFRKANAMPSVPEKLTFSSFASNERNYFKSLATCVNPQYIAAVNSRIAPMEDDPVIDGTVIGAADVSADSTFGISLGGGKPMRGEGIVSGSTIVQIPDISSKYKKSKKYSEWIKAAVVR
jgi:hypothetical protein